jgi:hypothetical protein
MTLFLAETIIIRCMVIRKKLNFDVINDDKYANLHLSIALKLTYFLQLNPNLIILKSAVDKII